ncbi:MAG: Mur ligase family protein, partial [archaeon]|nr:Mur ligase family protein [archaeon]
LTKEFYTIAVSGTHGKSTTTAMIGLLLTEAGLDPTVIVGTRVKEFGNSNCRIGESKYLVIESDEYAASFLNYSPDIIVLTSLEADHLDYYGTFEKIFETFQKYLGNLKPNGHIVANGDDDNLTKLLQGRDALHAYSKKDSSALKLKDILQVPGKHNVSNASAALSVASILNIPHDTALKALSQFKGTWRRFEIFEIDGPHPYTLVSDYGHHPTEIAATLQGAREKWPDKNIWLIYQPHQYHRTFSLLDEFVSTLSALPIQRLILADIYDVAGREDKEIKKQVSSQFLAERIQKNTDIEHILHISPKEDILPYLSKELQGGEIVIMMGAGTIYDLTLQLTK